jgi:tetratricopeptide (TPR) repeat protein
MRQLAGLRHNRPRWQTTATVAAIIIAAGAAAVAKWPHAWWWLILITAAAAAAGPTALTVGTDAAQRRQQAAQATRAALQKTSGPSGATPPLAAQANLEARVHQTVLPIPYIHRDDEHTIRDHLAAGRPVLLVGSSMIGKTRMAAQVITSTYGSWPAIIPDTKTALADLDAHDITIRKSVIWLDDIDRLIGAGGITDGALRRLAADGNVIMATIRAAEYDRFQPTDQVRPPEWDVLSVFERVFINRDLTPAEEQRLRDAVPNPDIQAQIRQTGLGEYVGAAARISEALQLGAAGAGGLGYAMVRAAADWRRCGMKRAVPAAMLPALAAPYVDNRHRAQTSSQKACAEGIAWATKDINPRVSLLQPEGTGGHAIYDYALDLITRQDPPIPDSTWDTAIENAIPLELLTVGYTAEGTYKRIEIALRAYRRAVDSGHEEASLMATVSLGTLLGREGDVEGARAAYQRAIDSGHEQATPLAAFGFGYLLGQEGDVEGARAAYQRVIDSSHEHATPMAAIALGELLAREGDIDIDGARAAYQQAIDSGDNDYAPFAAVRLGELLARVGDADGARAAYQQAIDSGHHDHAPLAAVGLGGLLTRVGDVDGARAAYQQAIDSGRYAPLASFGLGLLLSTEGDEDGARAAYQQAIDSGHDAVADTAAAHLEMLERQGRTKNPDDG